MSTVSVEEKEAFYAQLDLLDAPSDGDDETLKSDREVRERSRDFFKKAQAQAKVKVNSRKLSRSDHIKTLQKATIKQSDNEATPISARSTVIELTPATLGQDRWANRRRLPVSTSFVEDTPRQNHGPSGIASLKRSVTNPTTSSFYRPSPYQTPSMPNMAKRKRESMIPQDQMWLRGLRLFYIPGDRISLRRYRMEHAEKYGAVVTQVLGDATHIIVNDKLGYADIKDEEGMKIVVEKGKPVIVREHWPIDSIASKRLLPTNSVKYRIKGLPTAESMAAPPQEGAASQASKQSLELKAPLNNPNRWNYAPQSTSSQSEGSSEPHQDSNEHPRETVMGPALDQEVEATAGHDIVPSSQRLPGDGEVRTSPKIRDQGHNPDYEDELSQQIDIVQNNFRDLTGLGDDDDDDDNKSENKDGSDDDYQSGSEGERQAKRKKLPTKSNTTLVDHFACSRGGTIDKGSRAGGPNARVIAVLEQMLDYYTRTSDRFRTMMYRKAINTLSIQSVMVTTCEQAKQLRYIGDRIGSKIEDIVNTDRLQRLKYAENDPMGQSIKLFLGIYGVGTSTAEKWIAQGFRTLNALRQKGSLTPNQLVGLEHYDDLNSRIPRAEVAALGDYVKREAARIDEDVELLIGGSYRRGADSSGDIDFIVTKKGTRLCEELTPFLDRLVASLTERGFLTAELASHNSHGTKYHKDGNGSKWHGCCVLPRIPGSPNDNDDYRPVWRRIDLLLVPETEYGAALIYFTGNDIFNRSIRLLASKKKMRLNQRGLYKDAMRGPGRQKMSEGELIEGRSEKRIFEILGVKWRAPHERWC